MTESLQCPRCSGTEISQQTRYRNAKNGSTVGGWFPGCLLQLVTLSALVAAGGILVRIYRPEHPFAEAALLTATIAVIYAVGVGIFGLWIRLWPLVNEFACEECGYKWHVLIGSKRDSVQTTSAEKPAG